MDGPAPGLFDWPVWVVVLVGGLAVFRVWWLLGFDGLLASLRARLPERFLGWLTCPWCGGFWVSFVFVVVWLVWSDVWWVESLVVLFAVSGLVGLVGRAAVEFFLEDDDEGGG